MAALIVLTVLRNCCLPFVHDCFLFAGVGLIHTLCPGEYYECAILFDRPYLGLCSMHFDILLPGIYVTQLLLHGSPFGFSAEFGYSSTLCVRSLATLPFVKKNKQTKNKTQRKSKHRGSDLQLICPSLTHTVLISYFSGNIRHLALS